VSAGRSRATKSAGRSQDGLCRPLTSERRSRPTDNAHFFVSIQETRARDIWHLTRYPNTYKTIDALYHVRKNSKPCSAKKLIEYALKDHPGRPRETVTPGSDGLSILAAAASLADEAPAAEESRFEETAALSSIEQGVWSLQLDPTELDGTESGGFGSAQPESPRTEGELRCCPSLPLPNATSSPAAASPPPLGELRPDILLAPPPPAPAPPTRAAPRPR
jgi:hypothetical protein